MVCGINLDVFEHDYVKRLGPHVENVFEALFQNVLYIYSYINFNIRNVTFHSKERLELKCTLHMPPSVCFLSIEGVQVSLM